MKTDTNLLLLILCLAKGGCWAVTVKGYAGDSIIIKCKYDKEYTEHPKYFCKENKYSDRFPCNTLIKTEWSEGRFSLYDDKDSGYFKVIMNKLTKTDEGKYWCAVDIDLSPDEYNEVDLKVREGGPPTTQVTGCVGGAVMMKCSFSHRYVDNKKYFCKENSQGPGCEGIIETHDNNKWRTSDRFSLFYNNSGKFALVKIRGLTEKDAGKYQCAVDIPFAGHIQVAVDEHTEALLHVEEDPCCEQPMHVNAVVGQHLNITCKYPNRHRERPKFFCREADAIGCRYTFTSQDSRAKTDPGLYSLHDNRERSILVVSFRNVTKHHGGHYWCGVEVNWESGGYKAFITNVSLSVKASPTSTSSSRTTSSKTTTTTTTTTSALSFRPFSTDVTVYGTDSSAPTPQTHVSTVALSVSLTVFMVMFGTAFFICIRCRKRRGDESSPYHKDTAQSNNRVSALADGDYEEVKDTCISEDVYAEAQLPTNPCTNPTYSTVQFPISHGGDSTYSTVQSPADHPSYASVTFRKNPSSNIDSVTLNKDDTACDYETVSCPSPST